MHVWDTLCTKIFYYQFFPFEFINFPDGLSWTNATHRQLWSFLEERLHSFSYVAGKLKSALHATAFYFGKITDSAVDYHSKCCVFINTTLAT